ncbi:hypothetical protein [Bradyrhizobium sp. BR13661]|uniref:hypothetical protein n=1 Tax=Bradyrhizobium sp. BR13661 TaxID=2940622 RepID=UPI00247588AA|nr:hypothetical protein [Bradyrhizobium sp. BR13661]MDH6260007.1 hypothetical protein [Bradyrhizobium sp. BR13661]
MSGLANPKAGSQAQLSFDRLLSSPRLFAVDELACKVSADVIRSVRCSTRETASGEKPLLFLISLAAICHQMNWDFLSRRMQAYFETKSIDGIALSSISSRTISELLAGYHRPERIRATERANLLRDVGAVIVARYHNDPANLIAATKGRLYGEGGLLSLLDGFIAFREDPLRKKSNVLIHELVREDVASFDDESDIAPAIDYHIMRLYLRTGRVVPVHAATLSLLQADSYPRPRLVKLLRQAVSDALSLTSFYAAISIPELNTIEWQIGREICDRAQPHCQSVEKAVPSTRIEAGQPCPNSVFCRAFHDVAWRSLREPDLRKRFY